MYQLGIDVGTSSVKLALLLDENIERTWIERHHGRLLQTVTEGLEAIQPPDEPIPVAVTGANAQILTSRFDGIHRLGDIPAIVEGVRHAIPEAGAIIDIGGQGARFITNLKSGVPDFNVNEHCAGGTGSFFEDQMSRLGLKIEDYSELTAQAQSIPRLSGRCAVFAKTDIIHRQQEGVSTPDILLGLCYAMIRNYKATIVKNLPVETAIESAQAEGASQADIAAGLCRSVVKNYLHKVVGSKRVGQHIVLQGGVAYNPGIVAAFQEAYRDRLTVSPCFSISGAYGAALLALEAIRDRKSGFVGFDFPGTEHIGKDFSEEVQRNIAFYRKTKEAFFQNYDGTLDPKKKTVGIPYVLMIHRFFPMANAFFKALGYNVLLSDPSGEETIRLAQQTAQGETCYPVKLIYGHMMQLIEKKVDYIFMPNVHTIRHEKSRVAANYGCIYMQTAAASIAKILKLEERGITLLNPTFDLDFGKEAMAAAMLSVGKQLGKPKPLCAPALMSGAMAVRQYSAAAEKQGRELLRSLKPEDKVLVMITRNYGISDPVLNMGIPELLLQRSCCFVRCWPVICSTCCRKRNGKSLRRTTSRTARSCSAWRRISEAKEQTAVCCRQSVRQCVKPR